jgi:RNA-directed DNA polymerase
MAAASRSFQARSSMYLWVTRHLPGVRFARYADDAVLHCKSGRQAEHVLDRIRERFRACKLELHPDKTRIVCCKDLNRTEAHSAIQFTFLGHTFRPRKALDKYGRVYVNFSPAISRDALKTMRQTIRGWHLQLKSDKTLADLSAMFAPSLKGWQQYYGRFHGSALKPVWRHMNLFLIRWLMRKHKTLADHKPGLPRCSGDWRKGSRVRSFTGRWGICRRPDDGSRMS